jgi:hypothetical protein
MANSDKNIRITPNKGTTSFPKIVFTGQANDPITVNVLDDNSLSFSGSAGQLFSLSNNISSGTIFSVNDISGFPSFRINANGTISSNEFSGNFGIGLSSPSYKLQVIGTLGVSGGVAFTAGIATTSSSSGTLVVTGGAAIGSSLSVGGSLLFWNGSNYTAFKSSGSSTGYTTYTLPASTPAIGTSVLSSDISGTLSWIPMSATGSVSGGAGTVYSSGTNLLAYYPSAGSAVTGNTNISASGTGLSISFSTGSTSSITGALTVTGGVGIGQSLFTSSSYANSISGVVLNNGVITSGSWAGSSITGYFGGTGFNSYTKGDLLVGSGSTFIKVGSGTTNYILSSNSIYPSGIGWTWVTAVGIGTSPPSVNHDSDLWWNANDGTLNFYYNDGDSSQWVEISGGSGIDLSQPVNITSTVGSTSAYTGALTVAGGVGIAGTLHAAALVINGTYDVISQSITLASAGTTQVIHSLDASLFRTAKYMIQISRGSDFEVQEVLVLQDGIDAFLTQYAQLLSTNNLVLATYDADLLGGNMRLLAYPTYSSTTFKMYCTAMRN